MARKDELRERIRRRTQFLLSKARRRKHTIEGLLRDAGYALNSERATGACLPSAPAAISPELQ